VAVERNLEIVPKSTYGAVGLSQGDRLEIVHFIGGGNEMAPAAQTVDKPFVVAGRTLKSRLIIGTGKYKDYAQNAAALEASGAEMVTVALRRVNVMDPGAPKLIDFIDPKKFVYLPNTAGCYTAEEALRTLRLAREAGGWTLVKLEVLGDKKTLYPDMVETLRATDVLIREGFQVMVYCTDDPLMAKRLKRWARRDHAARRTDRFRTRYPESDQHPAYRRRGQSAGDRRCGRGDGIGCRHRHGARLRRRADEHRHCGSEESDSHGARDEARSRGGQAGLSCGTHAEEALRRSVESSCRADLMPADWESWFSPYAKRAGGAETRAFLRLVGQPGLISFAGGVPDSSLFPSSLVADAHARIFADPQQAKTALQYSVSEGWPPLREWLVQHMRSKGVACGIENILITSGSQQGTISLWTPPAG
jgi:hypothetical protein